MVVNKHSKKRTKTTVAKGVKGSTALSNRGGVNFLSADETDGNKIVQMIYDTPDPASYDS